MTNCNDTYFGELTKFSDIFLSCIRDNRPFSSLVVRYECYLKSDELAKASWSWNCWIKLQNHISGMICNGILIFTEGTFSFLYCFYIQVYKNSRFMQFFLIDFEWNLFHLHHIWYLGESTLLFILVYFIRIISVNFSVGDF